MWHSLCQMKLEFSHDCFCSFLCMLWLWLILTSSFPHISLLLMVTSSQSWVYSFFWRWFISKVIYLWEKSGGFPFFFFFYFSIYFVNPEHPKCVSKWLCQHWHGFIKHWCWAWITLTNGGFYWGYFANIWFHCCVKPRPKMYIFILISIHMFIETMVSLRVGK